MNYGRLFGHDYKKQGFYMVTLVTEPRRNLFSRIEAGQIIRTPAGDALLHAWLNLGEESPSISLEANAIMPDHFHGTLVVSDGGGKSLDWYMARLKGRVTHAVRKLENNPCLQIWEAGFHDWVSLNGDMFHTFKNYVFENPRRWQLRHDNKAFFAKQRAVKHPRLTPPFASDGFSTTQTANNGTATVQWSAVGDLSLLDYPMLIPVIVSRKTTGSTLEAEISRIVEQVRSGAIPISGFISPGERAVLKAVAALPRSRLICLLPYGMAEYKPRGKAVEAIAESKMLVLSGFPDAVPASPISYDNCHLNNVYARGIAAIQ